jgi:hypothetical protein
VTWRLYVLARTSTLRHKPSGVSIQTPLLIPSFSSKGFARSKDGTSEIGNILTAMGEFITETYLISAYDVYYDDIPAPADLPFTPDVIVLDSGGYEISTDRDYSSVIDPLPAPKPWDITKWESVVSAWPDELAMMAISFDRQDERKPFDDQVALARQRFGKCHHHLHSFLLKPETTSQMTLDKSLRAAIANAKELGSFDVIGVTEKELGRSMLDRMAHIASLRLAMDDAEVAAPIHVFGALDPVSVCLYYISGAEVFDGLTWIRYAYDEGRCVYTHNVGALKYGLHMRDDFIKSRALSENYYYLQDLQRRLREFETTGSYDKLKPHDKLVADAWDSLRTRLNRRSL